MRVNFDHSIVWAMGIFILACGPSRQSLVFAPLESELSDIATLIRHDRCDQAFEELVPLFAISPDNGQLFFLRGLCNQKLERFGLALADYHTSLRLNPNNEKAHHNLGMLYGFKLGDKRKALNHFDRFLSLTEDHRGAQTIAQLMLTLDESQTDANPNLLELIHRANQYVDPKQRREKLETGSELAPTSPIIPFLIGQAYDQEDNETEAIRYYKQALARRPTCMTCHQSLGLLLLRSKKTAEGNDHLRKAKLFSR